MKKYFFGILMLVSLGANAMDGTNWYRTFDQWFGETFRVTSEHEEHSGAINQILIGHMVNGTWFREEIRLKTNGQKIVYHFCLGMDGKCYEGRPYTLKPAMCQGSNDRNCAVVVMANTTENSPDVIGEQTAEQWARMLAHIALKLGFEKLVWGENIKGQNEVSSKFPLSPGPKFYEHKDKIIELANQFMAHPINNLSGNLLQ